MELFSPHRTDHSPTLPSLTSLREFVTSQCTALLNHKSEFGGGLDSGFSLCTAPTYYCRSKYFYSQDPQIRKLTGTEHSLNRDQCRVIIKLRVFPIHWRLEFRDS